MSIFEKRRLHRYEYWQGQMLRSADFQSQLADTAQHRWWHNRALHNPFGVYQGLKASALTASGGDLSGVTIDAGVAYDCFGRELIVDTPQNISLPINVPPAPVTMVLLVRYDAHADVSAQEMQEICWTGSSSQGTVTFLWLPEDRVRLHDGVPIAEVAYKDGRTTLQTFVPPGARPIARPEVASGATLPSTTAWEPWTMDVPHDLQTGVSRLLPTMVGVQARVNTSAAGFTQTPCYFAWLGGPLFNRTSGQLLPDMFTHLAEESPAGFTFRMWFPQPQIVFQETSGPGSVAPPSSYSAISNPGDFFPFARTQKLYVHWVALQMPPMVSYVPLRLRLLNALLLPEVLDGAALLKAKLAINLGK